MKRHPESESGPHPENKAESCRAAHIGLNPLGISIVIWLTSTVDCAGARLFIW